MRCSNTWTLQPSKFYRELLVIVLPKTNFLYSRMKHTYTQFQNSTSGIINSIILNLLLFLIALGKLSLNLLLIIYPTYWFNIQFLLVTILKPYLRVQYLKRYESLIMFSKTLKTQKKKYGFSCKT